ncbi:MAG TPA: DUF4271 domain-containing protein [Brumimicrobium sp.]|nr:DUF4271 domain-containing protein [Brumimicrobium sp.]
MNEFELILRKEIFPHWIIYALLFSIIILSVLKYQREIVFSNLKAALFNPPSSIPFSKGEISFFGSVNWILLLNYFLVSALAVYMILVYFDHVSYWLVILPIAYYAFQTSALFLIGLLSGESKKIQENILLLNFTTHNIGILLIPILLAWVLNPNLSTYVIDVLAIVFIGAHLIRVFRGVFLALRNKVLWYYIILYLCGLEIWPVIVGFLLLSPDSIG